MKKWLRNNGLSLTLLVMFFVFLGGQLLMGQREYNAERHEHGASSVGFAQYLVSGHCLEAVFENWESEFLQMAAYVALTAFLFQKGSAESKDPEEFNDVDEDPARHADDPDAPAPVHKGGFTLKLYERSLSIAFIALFLFSVLGHAMAGVRSYNEERIAEGNDPFSTMEYLGTSRFWFESFQNWQSEFLAVFSIVVLSIWLRQRGSPESKPVAAPHHKTGK